MRPTAWGGQLARVHRAIPSVKKEQVQRIHHLATTFGRVRSVGLVPSLVDPAERMLQQQREAQASESQLLEGSSEDAPTQQHHYMHLRTHRSAYRTLLQEPDLPVSMPTTVERMILGEGLGHTRAELLETLELPEVSSQQELSHPHGLFNAQTAQASQASQSSRPDGSTRGRK